VTDEREKGAAPLCRRSAAGLGMEETVAEKTKVDYHTDCLALVPSLNEACLFRIHV